MADKILFLDIDGVLNDIDFLMHLPKPEEGTVIKPYTANYDPAEMIDPARVARLNRIIEGADVDVVLSSSWRIPYELERVEGFLRARGFTGFLYDKTPHIGSSSRSQEIRRWLNQLAGEFQFVILDDMEDAGVGFGYRFVRVPNGLEDTHVEAARRVLGLYHRKSDE